MIDREAECATLDGVVDSVRRGQSRALVVHGDPGVGKTALLDYLARQASDFRLLTVAGIESEMELAFAALHQLCSSLLDRLERLPPPQRDALETTFGIRSAPAPDRFLVGLGALSLLSEAATERPLLCLVDDEQWLDRASASVLIFVAHRVAAESVGIVFGTRTRGADLEGLPELAVGGLREDDARRLLQSVLVGPIDASVRNQVLDETLGNPLAILELPRGLSPAELAGGFGLPSAPALATRIEESFKRRVSVLPDQTRRLLLLAAAHPAGDADLVWRAADQLGISRRAASPAADADLASFGATVRFRHPLVRSAVYHSASADERYAAHEALAAVTDPAADPDRRAWHLAHAAVGTDEDVAADLERCAARAEARGGLAAAGAFLEKAALLTPDRALRTRRALDAAEAKAAGGAFTGALELLAMAEVGPLSELEQARDDLVRARVAYLTRRGSDAPLLMLQAATRLGPIDAHLARATYLEALMAAQFAGRLAGRGGDVLTVARAARVSPRPLGTPSSADLLLEGLAANFVEGYTIGIPTLRSALTGFVGDSMPPHQEFRWSALAFATALHLWDDDCCEVISDRSVQLSRDLGALSELPLALTTRAYMLMFTGHLTAAEALVEDIRTAVEATGSLLAPYAAMYIAAFRGEEARLSSLVATTLPDMTARGEGLGLTAAHWASALINNGLGRYKEALAAAEQATEYPFEIGLWNWALAELIEAGARCGMTDTAVDAYRLLAERADASGTSWALGIAARSGALLAEGDDADSLFQEAIERLGRTRIRTELARAHLVYGEWLRRRRRRVEARARLRAALEMFQTMRMDAFADRCVRELRATGEKARKRDVSTYRELTPQETQVARLARDGLSNPEIGAHLFISPRTVEYHLSKVFAKLEITSRAQLFRALS
ncbi:MAG TPA: AAA family ATPase [Acidimicrobiales bacterium]